MAATSSSASAASPKPLYHATYELTSLMTQDALSVLTPTGASNPAYIACALLLAAMLVYGFAFEPQTVVMVVLATLCAGLMVVGGRWSTYMLARLQRSGLNAVQLPEDGRRYTVDVWGDRLEVTRPSGEMEVYPFNDIKHVYGTSRLILVDMKTGELALIPAKALSTSRYESLRTLLSAQK